MSSYWKDKVYKTLLGINSVVSYFLRWFLMVIVVVVCLPPFVIMLVVVVAGMAIMQFQETAKENLEAWAYGKDKIIHE